MANPVVDTPTPDQSDEEQSGVNFDISGNYSDADVTDSLTYSVLGLPVGTGLTMNPQTGILSGTPTAADTAASPISVTVRVTDDSGDVASLSFLLSTTQTPSEFAPNVIYKQDGSDDPNNPGVPVFTSLAAALASMSAGDVCEIQADTVGGTVFVDEGCVLPSSGTAVDKLRLQGRTGDTVHLYQVGGDCLEGVNRSHWQIHNIILGRDRTINGWTYATEGDNVEHVRTIDLDGCTNIRFSSCIFNGGSSYDSGNIRSNSSRMMFYQCTFQYTKSKDRGNGITGSGDRLCFVECTGILGGHDILSLKGKNCVIYNCHLDNDWTAFATNDYSRPFGMEGTKGGAPEHGPFLLQGNVMMNGRNSDVSGESNPTKSISRGGLVVGNFYVNFERNAIACTPLTTTALPSADVHVLHNTFYDIGSIWDQSDISLSNKGITPLDTGYQNIRIGNNIFAQVGNENRSGDTNAHIRGRYTNVARADSDSGGFSNALRNMEVFGNLIDMVTGDFYLDMRDGIATINETIATAETNQPTEIHDNTVAAPTFVNVGDRLSSDIAAVKAGLALSAGSNGEAAAEAIATVTATVTSTVISVSNAYAFVALRDANNFDLDYFSDDLPRHYVRIDTNAIVEVVAVDYANNQITIASSQSVTSGDNIFWADASNVWDNVGAAQ